MIPIEFLRQFQLGGYAVIDIAAALLAMFFLAPLLSKLFLKINLAVPKKTWLFLALPIGILVHLMIGNITPMTANFFDPSGHYGLKLFILTLTVLGLKDCKISRLRFPHNN